MTSTLMALAGLALLGGPAPHETRVQGDYIESRTADVYTGPCFSNAEIFLTGHQALLAWHIRRGEWKGVDVSDMIVAAAVRGTTTLGADDRDKAESVIIVDSRASEKQRKALEDLARELGGKRLNNIKGVRVASMIHFVEDKMDSSAEHEGLSAHHAGPATPRGCFWAEGLAEMNTRPLEATDHVCGNEVIAYQPLSKGVQAQPAYTLVNAFKGKGLDTNWDDHNCRGSFVGHFAY